MQLYAISDIGTNSVRLLLAEYDGQIHAREKLVTTTRIGAGLAQSGLLGRRGMEDTIDVLQQYQEKAQRWGAPLYAFATSAVRDAGNKEEFLQLCRRRLGLQVQVISGEQEACWGFLGAAGGGSARLIDIGGGSTELIQGENGRILRAMSAPIGCVRAMDWFSESEEDLCRLRQRLRDCSLNCEVSGGMPEKGSFAALAERMGQAEVLAVGGTATSLCAYSLGMRETYDGAAVQDVLLCKDQLEETLRELKTIPRERRRQIPLLGRRGDLIVYGGALLLECMELLKTDRVRISDRDNLEGCLLFLLGQETESR